MYVQFWACSGGESVGVVKICTRVKLKTDPIQAPRLFFAKMRQKYLLSFVNRFVGANQVVFSYMPCENFAFCLSYVG